MFERGWPTAPAAWRRVELEVPMNQILELRALVNRQLESCRASGQLGASLEAQVHLEIGVGAETTAQALQWLERSHHPSVDNLADWLLVSALQQGGAAPADVLAEASEGGIRVRIEIGRAHV